MQQWTTGAAEKPAIYELSFLPVIDLFKERVSDLM
jgi:hypothetical protein